MDEPAAHPLFMAFSSIPDIRIYILSHHQFLSTHNIDSRSESLETLMGIPYLPSVDGIDIGLDRHVCDTIS